MGYCERDHLFWDRIAYERRLNYGGYPKANYLALTRRATILLAAYLKRMPSIPERGHLWPGYQLQAYCNWRAEWTIECTRRMDPDDRSSEVGSMAKRIIRCYEQSQPA